MYWQQMVTMFQRQVYKNCAVENSVASKLVFSPCRMAQTPGGVNSSLTHLNHSSFSQEFVFLNIPLLSSQLSEVGVRNSPRALPAGGHWDSTPGSSPGPALPACCWSNHAIPRREKLKSTVWGWRVQELSPCKADSHMLYSLDKAETWEKGEPRRKVWGCRELCRMVQLWEVGAGKPFLVVVSRFAGAFA